MNANTSKVLVRILLFLGFLLIAAVVLFALVHRDRRPRVCIAAECGDTNYLAQYLASGGNVSDTVVRYRFEPRSAPLLHIAAWSGQLNAVDWLLQRRANPDLRDDEGYTALLAVIGHGENEVAVQVLQRLLRAGADPNLKSSSGFWTPLINAADLGEAKFISELLAAGTDVHATNNQGSTALHFASTAEVARLLIAAGADRTISTGGVGGETPADSAIRFAHSEALKVITNGILKTNN